MVVLAFKQSVWQDLDSETTVPGFPCFHYVQWLFLEDIHEVKKEFCSGAVKHDICVFAPADLKKSRKR